MEITNENKKYKKMIRNEDLKGGYNMKLKPELMKEVERLLAIKEKVEKNLKDVPEGRLRLGKSGGCVQYYHCKNL